jgi:hypothetical protein
MMEPHFDSEVEEVVELQLGQHCAHPQAFSEGAEEAERLLNLDLAVAGVLVLCLEVEVVVQKICAPQ